jgi:uncharacterized membrane protein
MRKILGAPLFCLVAAACSQSAEQKNNGEGRGNAANVAAAPADAGNAARNIAASAPVPAPANEAAPAPSNQAAPAGEDESAPVAAQSYEASGSEPFWALKIAKGKMAYTSANGPNVTEAILSQANLANGYRYRGKRISVVTHHEKCQDANEEIFYSDTVKVTVDGQTVSGCGG